VSELGEVFAALKEHNRKKKQSNHENSMALLKERGYSFEQLSDTHYRYGDFDFWPSTGKFVKRSTGKYKRGVFNLLKELD
jgi:hypothetical protein